MKIVSCIAAVFDNLTLVLLLLLMKQLQNGYNMIVFENAGAPKHGAEQGILKREVSLYR